MDRPPLDVRPGVTSDPRNAFDEAVSALDAGAGALDLAADLVAAMTPDERLWCLDGDLPCWAGLADLGRGGYHRRPFPAARVPRLGIPGFAFSDGPRGVVIGPATCFPVSMARGATWDPDLEERIGDAIGRELRAVGADLYGGVCVNVLRHPAWGRAQETYGEDPFHVGEMGAALARGVQRHAMACVKHFACNSMENARFRVDVTVDDEALHEVYLPHFRRIVDEGVAVVMSAYNSVNGEWCGQHRALLTEILREEWGFDGFVISDWIFGLREAGASLAAGLDVEMPFRMMRAGGLPAALEDGDVTEADVERAVVRVVATLLRWQEVLRRPRPGLDVLACADHRALAREAAARSVVLLRNEPLDGAPVLPLDGSSLRRVAVVGRLGAVRNLGDGGSSDVWAPEVVTPLDGIRAALPGAEVVHDGGDDPAAAAALADACDVAVVVVGYTREDEGEFIGVEGTAHLASLLPGPDEPDLAAAFEASIVADPGPNPPPGVAGEAAGGFATGGDRVSLRLHDHDEALIRAVASANPRTVVALVAGSAVVVESWVDRVPAVVQSWYAGMEGGHGLADVLLGRVDAAGRLPFSVPVDPGHLPHFDREADAVTYDAWHGWWMLERDGHAPRFPFGFGLSYTSFRLGELRARADDAAVVVRGTLHNTGRRTGSDVVQVYAALPSGGRRRLVGFARVEVDAGGSRDVAITVPREGLGRWDPGTRGWVVDSGRYELVVARHAADPDGRLLAVEL
jgi:beta-glucosidase-like glycosyl hydrolase